MDNQRASDTETELSYRLIRTNFAVSSFGAVNDDAFDEYRWP
ncbi:hypothetical protein M2432_003294 [Mycobacterium sp. OTB74]|nr:hypothetical protein [Mycobacterium sp. OTB74]